MAPTWAVAGLLDLIPVIFSAVATGGHIVWWPPVEKMCHGLSVHACSMEKVSTREGWKTIITKCRVSIFSGDSVTRLEENQIFELIVSIDDSHLFLA